MKLLPPSPHASTPSNYQHEIKLQNIKRAFDLIRTGRCESRVELSRETGLSATAVSSLAEALLEANMIREIGSSYSPVPGRRAIRFRLNESGKQMPVFSLSSHGIRFTLFDLGCNVIEQFTVPFPPYAFDADQNPCAVAGMIEDILLRRSRHFDRERAIVIGLIFPGTYIDSQKMFSVESAMNLRISEDSLRTLALRFGVPVMPGNVSLYLAYAEQKRCYPEDSTEKRNLIFFNICDGVGAGVILDGDIMWGSFDTAGEVGHISIDCNGLPCRCGNRGCLERYINQNAILERVRAVCRESGIAMPDSFAEITECIHLPCMSDILEDIARKLAFGVYSMMCATGIRRIVLGGGIEILGDALLKRTKELILQRHILSEHLRLNYAQTAPEEDSLGLAMYFLDKEFRPLS